MSEPAKTEPESKPADVKESKPAEPENKDDKAAPKPAAEPKKDEMAEPKPAEPAKDDKAAPKPAAEPKDDKAAPKPAAEPKKDDKPEAKPAEPAKDDKAAPKPAAEPAKETELKPKDEPAEEKPKPKVYTAEEIAEIAKRVETPSDQTPPYKPKHILSPEYSGTSNYEIGLSGVTEEARQKLAKLEADPDSNQQEIDLARENLKKLENLYENYNIGMNVFRVAKGGRDKLRV